MVDLYQALRRHYGDAPHIQVVNNTIVRWGAEVELYYEDGSRIPVPVDQPPRPTPEQVEAIAANYPRLLQQDEYDTHDARAEAARQSAYRELNLTLLGLVQLGEVTQEEYVAACNAVKARFPYLAEMTLEQKQAMYPLVAFI